MWGCCLQELIPALLTGSGKDTRHRPLHWGTASPHGFPTWNPDLPPGRGEKKSLNRLATEQLRVGVCFNSPDHLKICRLSAYGGGREGRLQGPSLLRSSGGGVWASEALWWHYTELSILLETHPAINCKSNSSHSSYSLFFPIESQSLAMWSRWLSVKLS